MHRYEAITLQQVYPNKQTWHVHRRHMKAAAASVNSTVVMFFTGQEACGTPVVYLALLAAVSVSGYKQPEEQKDIAIDRQTANLITPTLPSGR